MAEHTKPQSTRGPRLITIRLRTQLELELGEGIGLECAESAAESAARSLVEQTLLDNDDDDEFFDAVRVSADWQHRLQHCLQQGRFHTN